MSDKPSFIIHLVEYHTENVISINMHHVASYRIAERREFKPDGGQSYIVNGAYPTEVKMMTGDTHYVLDNPSDIDRLMAEAERGEA